MGGIVPGALGLLGIGGGGPANIVGGLLGEGGPANLATGLLGEGGLGGLATNLMEGLSGITEGLIDAFGMGEVSQAANNTAGEILQTELNSMIDELPIPPALQDTARDIVNITITNNYGEVSCECQDAVNKELGGAIEESVGSMMEMIQQMMQEQMQESTEEAGSGSGEANGSGGGEKGNWLMILAKALGKASGEHLATMIEKGQQMGDMEFVDESGADGKTDTEAQAANRNKQAEFAQVQSEFQAASQVFKMFQEAISTMLKSVGEGMSSVARKQ